MNSIDKSGRYQGPPNALSHAEAIGLLWRGLVFGIKSFVELILLTSLFIVAVLPVFTAASFMLVGTSSPWPRLGASLIIAATSYLAYIAGTMLLLIYENKQASDQKRSTLSERWPQLRRETLTTLLLGALIIGLAECSRLALTLGGLSAPPSPLFFYAIAGAPMMALASHFRACLHLPQILIVSNSPLDGAELAHLSQRACERYGRPLADCMFGLVVLALLFSYFLPVTGILVWLLSIWYTHVTMVRCWRPKQRAR